MRLSFILLMILSIIKLINSKIISIPFQFQSIKRNYLSFSSSDFIDEFYKKVLILELNIGTPSQKINAYLNPSSYCIEMKLSELSTTNYYPHKSTSFNIDKSQTEQNNLFKLIVSNDIFNFNKNESYKFSFVVSEKLNISTNQDISLIPEIGINNPIFYYELFYQCNNFIYGLKEMKAIDKKMFSIKLNDKFGGEFILGKNMIIFILKKNNIIQNILFGILCSYMIIYI